MSVHWNAADADPVVSTPEAILQEAMRRVFTQRPTVTHSGQTWTSLGRTKYGELWPIGEYLARTKHSPAVAERIRRLYPHGKEEGSMTRGWHPHPRSCGHRWETDAVTVCEFIAKFGRAAYRALPRTALVRDGHRKAITRRAVKDASWLA